MNKTKLTRLIDSLEILEHEIDCHKCTRPSDEEIKSVITEVIEALTVSGVLHGDG